MRPLPIAPAWHLAERDPELRWLVTHLWSQHAVGIVGGEPKCCKSFLALDLAVAVAAGVPCLRRFTVSDPGRVLLYAAEDAHPIVRRRLKSIATAAGVALRDLDMPSCGPNVACVPPRSMSGLLRSPPTGVSSRPATVATAWLGDRALPRYAPVALTSRSASRPRSAARGKRNWEAGPILNPLRTHDLRVECTPRSSHDSFGSPPGGAILPSRPHDVRAGAHSAGQ
jgi:hypothetical protein